MLNPSSPWLWLTLLVLIAASDSLGAGYPDCKAAVDAGPVLVTANCVDPLYSLPIIDSETDQVYPVPHRRVSGHWNGTDVDFNIYLPSKASWARRFFQNVYPTQNSTLLPEAIEFGAVSGGYSVCTAGTLGYRADAATAKFSRSVAASYYNTTNEEIYGYIYGGSGGSYQTVGAAENTYSVWDGAVVYVQAVPGSVPLNLCARALANLILRHNASLIEEALRPGGTGNPFAELNAAEVQVLEEVTKFGVPLQSWEDFLEPADSSSELVLLTPAVQDEDPTYAEDFWSKPGYLGTERSDIGALVRGALVRGALVDHVTTVVRVDYNSTDIPSRIGLDWIPAEITAGLNFTLYDGDGLTAIGPLKGSLSLSDKQLILDPDNDDKVTQTIVQGSRLRIDNRWHIALHGYHRHQIPTYSGFYGYGQYRTPTGEPLYPQRVVKVGENLARATSGGATHTGNLTMNMIVVDNLLDSDALPWHADWYKSQVKHASGDNFDDVYRLWYNERSDHYAEPLNKTRSIRLVPYNGIYEQALRDLSAWVERGISAPKSTIYTVVDSQIKPVSGASNRRGVQPTTSITADQSITGVGKSVTFHGSAHVPAGTGKIVSVQWDFLGTGDFVDRTFGPPSDSVHFGADYVYHAAGDVYPSVRVIAQRYEAVNTSFCRIYNLARTSVTVQ